MRSPSDPLEPVYGPVPSWRLGASLGIDLACSRTKVCTFNCIYCQLGRRARLTRVREVLVPTKRILGALRSRLRKIRSPPDYITFSGTGEPTLAANLGEVLDGIKRLTRVPVAILTNSSLIFEPKVVAVLKDMDFVVAKLDAPDASTFKVMNRPIKGVHFDEVVDGLIRFRKIFSGKLALQMMFVEKNRSGAANMAALAKEIRPDEVQINTPLRECPVRPLSPKALDKVAAKFHGLRVISVYRSGKPDIIIDDIKGLRDRRRPEGRALKIPGDQ